MAHNKKDAMPAVRQASLSGGAAAVPSWPVPAHPRSKRRPAPVARGRTNARAAPAPAATPRSRGDRVERSMGQSMGQRVAWSRKGSIRKRIRKGGGKRGGGKHGWRRGERENGQNNAQGFTPPSRGEAGGAVARLSRRREGLLRHTRMDEGEKLAPAAAPLCGTGGIGSGVPTGMWAEPRARGARSRAGPRAATCDPEAGHISSPCPTTRPRWET